LVTTGSVCWWYLQHEFYNRCHLLTEMFRNPWILSFDYLFVKTLHVISSKRWNKGKHLIQYTTKWPDITLRVIRHVSPYFWTCIIRSTSLSIWESFFDNLGNIEISKFGLHILIQEYVCAL
jgi:hypothetical protein